MTVITELSTAAKSVVERAGPAVVRVGRNGGRGNGVVFGPGRVVTNAHNLRGDEITVTFADGRSDVGRVLGVDVDGDLAVVAVETEGTAAIEWADTDIAQGDAVFALSRSAAGGVRVSFGMVSATERSFRGPRGRRIRGSLEHTAPLVRGSSGGPVVDADGRLLGVNTNRLGDGYYLAIPATAELKERLDGLAAGEVPSPKRLGVGLAPAGVARRMRQAVGLPARDGLLVRVVEPASPADRAGLQPGDLLVAADGHDLAAVDDLFSILDAAGDGLDLKILRGADELDVRVQFGAATTTEGTA
ncbi:MAG: S1C family serine protease [Acidimicrobiales bacterium]